MPTHHGETELLRIRKGGRLPIQDGDVCAIGMHDPFKELMDRARTVSEDDLWYGYLHREFIFLITTSRHEEVSVGGFPIAVRASPDGHRYLGFDGGYTYKFPPLWGRVTVQPIEQVYSGDGHFQLIIMPSSHANVPVVGACLVQARKGFVYSPIEHPENPTPHMIDLLPGVEQWKGREREMFTVLRAAIAGRVAVVASL